MRAALISQASQPRAAGTGGPLAVAGKTIAERQIEFAHAAGCGRILLLGDGTSPDAIALSHTAEAAGLQVQTIPGPRGLLGAVAASDQLLVLAPGLLPDSPTALAALSGAPRVLVMEAAATAGGGFERIDLERAWAGALVMPGALVENLAELPGDIDPQPALLRIALQAGVTEHRLPESVPGDGSWAMVSAANVANMESAWIERHVPRVADLAPSESAVDALLRKFHGPVLSAGYLGAALPGTLVAAAVLGPILSASGFSAAGFAVVALAAFVSAAASRVARLRASPRAAPGARSRMAGTVLVDAALIACSAGAIEGDWAHRLFPPLMLVGALHLPPSRRWPHLRRSLGDRSVLALLLALAAAFGRTELAIMALALTAIAIHALKSAAPRG